MKKEIIEEMNNFALRVLRGENNSPQETAILPQILEKLENLPDEQKSGRSERQSLSNS